MVHVPSMYSTIQMAKKPAIIAKIAATPPFETKEVAPDEVVGDEAAELAAAELVGTEPVEPLDVGVDAEKMEIAEEMDITVEMEDAEELEDPEPPDAEDDAALTLPELVGEPLAPVEVTVESSVELPVTAAHCDASKASAAVTSAGGQFD